MFLKKIFTACFALKKNFFCVNENNMVYIIKAMWYCERLIKTIFEAALTQNIQLTFCSIPLNILGFRIA